MCVRKGKPLGRLEAPNVRRVKSLEAKGLVHVLATLANDEHLVPASDLEHALRGHQALVAKVQPAVGSMVSAFFFSMDWMWPSPPCRSTLGSPS